MSDICNEELKIIIQKMLLNSGENAVYSALVNDLQLNVPAPMLAMFFHCLHSEPDTPIRYYIETKHLNWALSHLSDGNMAVDVGASGGILTAALAHRVGPAGRVFSFEPAHRALWLLQRIVQFNNLENVVIVPKAVSDSVGRFTFTEYSFDPQSALSWAPEISSLGIPDSSRVFQTYDVETVTLDAYFSASSADIGVIKIDVEGYEAHVLRGAQALLERCRPALAIDIHSRVDATPGTTEDEVRSFLLVYGYSFSMLDHVLLAEYPRM